ncbi:hypothetical protein [Dasania marina]|uniref:hypothetical protein n=1 Tax=Dasania marina TaxID=471499 RepID=UPI0030D89DB8
MLKANNMLRLVIVVVVGCLVSTLLQARVLTAEGYGATREGARIAALETLGSSIFVQLESDSKLYEDSTGKSNFSSSTSTSTDLPLIGVEYSCYQATNEQLCQASLDTTKAAELYRQKSNQLAASIENRLTAINNTAASQRYDQLLDILANYDSYQQYRTVLLFFGAGNEGLAVPSYTRDAVVTQITALEAQAPSLTLAAQLLTRGIKAKAIFIQPATPRDSHEITPFSSALLSALRTRISSVSERAASAYVFSGTYQQHENGITVSYSLTDRQGNILQTRVAELAPSSYQHLQTQPQSPDFDRLLHQGYAIASDFQAYIATNKGLRQLLFLNGEEIEILIKINQPGYFYLVGHIKNDQDELSYLVDMNDAEGDRRFVYYVNADEVNKWVSIGAFVVQPPFGVESLQLIASRKDLVGALPAYQYDPATDYYVLAHDISLGVMKTRGLKKKKLTVSEAERPTEAVLMFTTQSK